MRYENYLLFKHNSFEDIDYGMQWEKFKDTIYRPFLNLILNTETMG